MTLPTREERLARAKAYPYPRPECSFLFVNGRTYTFPDASWRGVDHLWDLDAADSLTGQPVRLSQELEAAGLVRSEPQMWTPVLAIGSNSSPQQLARKYNPSDFPKGVVIPAVRAVLEGFDVVYAPLITSYGSCPATLEVSPGTAMELYVTYLTPEILDHMHSTEGGYDLLRLRNIRLHLAASLNTFRARTPQLLLNEMLQYNYQLGSFCPPCDASSVERSPIALQAIPAEHRRFPSLLQEDMLRRVQKHIGRESDDLDDWIVEHLESLQRRMATSDSLALSAQAFSFPNAEIVLELHPDACS